MSHQPVITAAPSALTHARPHVATRHTRGVPSILIMLPLPVQYDQEGRLLWHADRRLRYSPYPRDLIGANGWGILTPQHRPAALARTIGLLDRDRDRLAEMVKNTSSTALTFNDVAVFRHRSELIKAYL